ncbi:MAG TPA: 2OG-Fe(II) oxygenase [Candidatus Sulfotelmatobacter sp.]|nr:2OG-Fe(II) oxygenase [Candidatus Sulfotelmatobacter sp.]
MTPKQILDSFSETLMRDERILSAQERALVASLLQHAKTAASTNPETNEAVKAVIAAAIGETVAQRAFSVLGGSIVERIIESGSLAAGETAGTLSPDRPLSTLGTPTPPGPQPEHPGTKAPRKEPQPPLHSPTHRPLRDAPSPSPQPQHPGSPKAVPSPPTAPSQPQHPGGSITRKVVSGSSVAAAERPEVLRANCVVLDEFLSPQELEELTRFTMEHQADFQNSEVYSPSVEKGVINDDFRRSRVLMELEEQQELILQRIKSVLPQVLERLGMEEFTIADVEAQITASNDGDFFHCHDDNGSEGVASRHLTFVYFFHREPRQFEGGELRIHDAHLADAGYISDGSYQTIVPQQNQIVFFPCELMHEITPVQCASQFFADSRFTLNGWLRR